MYLITNTYKHNKTSNNMKQTLCKYKLRAQKVGTKDKNKIIALEELQEPLIEIINDSIKYEKKIELEKATNSWYENELQIQKLWKFDFALLPVVNKIITEISYDLTRDEIIILCGPQLSDIIFKNNLLVEHLEERGILKHCSYDILIALKSIKIDSKSST